MTGASTAEGDRPTGAAAADRPWSSSQDVRWTKSLLQAWRRSAEGRADSVLPAAMPGRGTSVSGVPRLTPGISVVMPTYRGRERITTSLESLAAQTLAREQFEIIVALNGPDDGTYVLIQEFRRQHPTIELRTVRMARASAARASNAGIAAASRAYTTFVDDDDYVSPAFLEVILENAGPDVISIAPIIDVPPDGGAFIMDNYINRELVKHPGELMTPAELFVGTSNNALKAVPTHLIKDIRYPVDLRSFQDVIFWVTLAVNHDVRFYVCPQDSGAAYYRVLRPDSISRQPNTFDFNVTQRLTALAHLDRLAGIASPNRRPFVLAKMRAMAGFIGRYLDEHPDDRATVLEAIDRSGVANMPYYSVNGKTARRLVISAAFPPGRADGAIAVAKRVRAMGEVVDVIHASPEETDGLDDSAQRIVGPLLGIEVALEFPTASHWSTVAPFVARGLAAIEKREITKGHRYDSVYSLATSPAERLLAAAYKLSNPDTKWTAEFATVRAELGSEVGDADAGGELIAEIEQKLRELGMPIPVVHDVSGWSEELALALADDLVFTSAGERDDVLGRIVTPGLVDLASRKATVTPCPVLPEQLYPVTEQAHALDDGTVDLAYFAGPSPVREIDDVLLAIASVTPSVRDHVRIHVFGIDVTAVEKRAQALSIADFVATTSRVGYLGFVSLLPRFDGLIVSDLAPDLPSMLPDYREKARSIWCLAGDVAQWPADLGLVTLSGDLAAARSVLSELVAARGAPL